MGVHHRALLPGVRPIGVATIWMLEALKVCSPGTGHQAPVNFTRHQSSSPGTSQPVTRQLITGQPGTGLPDTSQPDTRQIITHQPGTRLLGTGQPDTGQPVTSSDTRLQSLVTSRWSSRHRSSSSDYQALGTTHQSPSNQSPGTSQLTRHWSLGNNWSALNTGCPVTYIRVLSIHYQMSLRTQGYCYYWSQTLVPCQI